MVNLDSQPFFKVTFFQRPNWKRFKALHHFQPRHRIHRIAPHHVSWPPSQVPTGAEFVLHCAWDRWNYASPAHVRSLEVWGRRLAMKPTVNRHVAETNMIKNFIRFYLQHAANVQLFMRCDVQFHPWCWLSFWNVATTFREVYVFFCSRSIEKARAFVLNRPSGI